MVFRNNRLLRAAALMIAVVGAGVPAAALAADKDQVIKDRQALMKDQIRQWLAVRNYIQGKADQAQAASAVDALSK